MEWVSKILGLGGTATAVAVILVALPLVYLFFKYVLKKKAQKAAEEKGKDNVVNDQEKIIADHDKTNEQIQSDVEKAESDMQADIDKLKGKT